MIDLQKHKEILDIIAAKYEINTPLRMSHFLAQIDHESAGLTKLVENLNYSVQGLLATFSRNRITQAQAMNLGRIQGRPANQEAIANIIYGGEFGRKNLGNNKEGDGWKYRGRGPLQCTGRINYANFGAWLQKDFVSFPEMLEHLDIGLEFAGWFWMTRGCNLIADNNQLQSITKKINGGLNGLYERKALLQKYKKLLNDTSTAE